MLESFREVTKRSFKLLREVLKKGGYPQFGGLEGQEGGNPSDQDFVKGKELCLNSYIVRLL